MPLMSQAEYSRHANISTAAVTNLIKRGRLEGAIIACEDGRKIIDSDIADQIRKRSVNPPRKDRAKKKTVADQKEKMSTIFEAGIPNCANFTEAQKIDREYQAALRKLDLEERQGKLIPKEDVDKEAFDLARKVRDAVLSIPERISAPLAVISDESEIKLRLTKELRQALLGVAE